MQTLNKVLTGLVGAATVLTVANVSITSVQAATLTFNLNGSSQTSSFFDFTVDGVTLTATGKEGAGNSRNVRRTGQGLGVIGDNGPDNQVDGRGVDETLLLELDQRVRIISAVFSRVQNNDQFKVTINGDGATAFEGDIEGTGNNRPFNFSSPFSDIVGTEFGFSVRGNNDDYSLKSVTFSTVPEPATILGLMAVGVAAGTGLRKRQAS
jgi:hypothetical protein